MDQLKINKLHELIEDKKVSNRISYSKLGNVVGYSPEGVKKALANKTLKISFLKDIAKKFDFVDDFNAIVGHSDSLNLSKSDDSIRKLALDCVNNWDQLKEIDTFKHKMYDEIGKILNVSLDEIIENGLKSAMKK
ncbi:hypothetical protein [Aquimarina intermedia]|uniref:Uncharacterized protein n=1 Tax=Aquimarina intermedia TaxID=350814 RepID=A0A5S5BX33_9FLAO|nr:hypothetical protein [Aquimarina intermedia]TYP71529.1 hypothetical protein BD809_109111 [Aquimarina intermedia]